MTDAPPSNLVLAALPEVDRRRVEADLTSVDLVRSTVLAEVGEPLRSVTFPAGGAVSLVTATVDGGSVEAVLIGNEGLVGTWIAAGIEGAPWRTIVQAGGAGFQMSPQAFRAHVAAIPIFGTLVARYNIAAHLLTSQSAACNRFHELSARTARWLLMVSDRTGSDEIRLTQEFLSQMLGAYRPSVTVALRFLGTAGIIAVGRSRITLLDRGGLLALACECYRVSLQQHATLLRIDDAID